LDPSAVNCVFDAGNSECRVYVRRAGLLAAVGHDLEIRVGEYRIEFDRAAPRVMATFSADSLRVVDAVEGRRLCPGKISVKDKAQIDKTIRDQILRAVQHPTIVFDATAIEAHADDYHVRGQLTLHGCVRELSFVIAQRADQLSAQVVVHQPDFSITPFRAVGGALRIQPDVTIEFRARMPAAGAIQQA